MIKLSKYAKQNGISYMTAYRHFHLGYLKGKQLISGTILIYEDSDNNVKLDTKLNNLK